MFRHHRDLGYGLAALGSAGLAASLWLPWYSFQIPPGVLDQAVQSSRQFGILGPLVREGAELIRKLGPIHVTAWQVFHVMPALLLVVGVLGGGLSLLALTGRATGGARFVASVGLAGIVLTLYRYIERPAQSDVLHLAWGIYLALLGAACISAGGLIARAGERAGDRPAVTADLGRTMSPAAVHVDGNSQGPPRRGERFSGVTRPGEAADWPGA